MVAYAETFENTKGIIRSRKLQDRQYNGQKNKDKQLSTKTMQKTKDWATRTHKETDCFTKHYFINIKNSQATYITRFKYNG